MKYSNFEYNFESGDFLEAARIALDNAKRKTKPNSRNFWLEQLKICLLNLGLDEDEVSIKIKQVTQTGNFNSITKFMNRL